MTQILPILCPPPAAARLRAAGRAGAAALLGGCLALLLIARHLPPDPSGVGTHKQLGQTSCQFLSRTGVPCPTCGMTTSFSHFVRGHMLGSIYVQPMGALLAMLTAVVLWAALYAAITGRPVHRLLRFVPARYYGLPLLALAILAWAWKIFIHLHGIDGW